MEGFASRTLGGVAVDVRFHVATVYEPIGAERLVLVCAVDLKRVRVLPLRYTFTFLFTVHGRASNVDELLPDLWLRFVSHACDVDIRRVRVFDDLYGSNLRVTYTV